MTITATTMSGLHSLTPLHVEFFASLSIDTGSVMTTQQLQSVLQDADQAVTKLSAPLTSIIARQMLTDLKADFWLQ
jgi:hypothetical protein